MRTAMLLIGLVGCAGTVTLRGVAADAKGGAVLQTDDGRVVYVDGLERWPDAVAGHPVKAQGRLTRRKLIPDPVVGPAGERSAGAVGDQTVLEQATWSQE
jgi:hypothetical protein